MSNTTPTLTYVGSVDNNASTLGSSLFNILFDSSLVGTSGPLMFEYMIYTTGTSPTPSNIVESGFIYPESAQSDGISNQWTVPVPATTGGYNPSLTLAMRVYSSAMVASGWSNTLAFYNPPSVQTIAESSYLPDNYTANSDDLFVLLSDNGVDTSSPDLRFVVSYYYTEADTQTTKWVVTSPLSATPIQYNGSTHYLVQTTVTPKVSTLSANLYVAVNAVYPFDYNGTTYYTVSEISNTFTAIEATIQSPALHGFNDNSNPSVYTVYDDRSQNIILNWTAPSTSYIAPYNILNYKITLTADSSSGGAIAFIDSISNTATSYTIDLTSFDPLFTQCGSNLSFMVTAVNLNDSRDSNVITENVFKYSAQPATLQWNWAVYNDDTSSDQVQLAFSFTNPSTTGCGVVTQYTWNVLDETNNSIVQTGNVAYDGLSSSPYIVKTLFDYTSANVYKVQVYLSTTDTNSNDVLDGASNYSSSIIPTRIPYFLDIAFDGSIMTGKIVSDDLLKPGADVIYIQPGAGELQNTPIAVADIASTPTRIDADHAYEYIFSVDVASPSIAGNPVPGVGLAVANVAGVGVGRANIILP